jgi:hypothetical protein
MLQAIFWSVIIGLAIKHRKGVVGVCVDHPLAMTVALVCAAVVGFTLGYVL